MGLLRSFVWLVPFVLAAQTVGTLNIDPDNIAAEQAALSEAVAEGNGSPVDLIRGLEQHLRRYPDSARRADIESNIYKNAAGTNDRPRIVLYGEKMLASRPSDEMEILDRMIHALLATDDTEAAKRGLTYARRYEADVMTMRARTPEGHTTAAQWADLADRTLARATVLEARATGNLGNPEEAVVFARRAWSANPTAESAQEVARWLVKLGREAEALEYYADAVMIDDARFSWSDRDGDRKVAMELYVRSHGSEEGLGDLFLRAWERSAAAIMDRVARYKAMDRNYGVTDAFGFVLAGTGGDVLDMAKLKGKTVIVDFWATWCGPCVAQHPMIEDVKQKYAQASDVVFLSLDADDDHSLVEPFMKAHKWNQRVYPEGGLAGLLKVSALPTILVIDPSGKVFSRVSGFNGGLFESMLSARIDEARSVTGK